MHSFKLAGFRDFNPARSLSRVTWAVAVLAMLTGCVPTKQLVNDASVQFNESQNLNDPQLNSNKVGGVAILVSTGYIQVRNERQLSVYLECATLQQHLVTLVSGELMASNKVNLVPESLGILCPDERLGGRSETGIYTGAGYMHFFGSNLNDYFKSEEIRLSLSIEIDGNQYQLSLPLRVEVVWVWPT